jgi:hypothetical protein
MGIEILSTIQWIDRCETFPPKSMQCVEKGVEELLWLGWCLFSGKSEDFNEENLWLELEREKQFQKPRYFHLIMCFSFVCHWCFPDFVATM